MTKVPHSVEQGHRVASHMACTGPSMSANACSPELGGLSHVASVWIRAPWPVWVGTLHRLCGDQCLRDMHGRAPPMDRATRAYSVIQESARVLSSPPRLKNSPWGKKLNHAQIPEFLKSRLSRGLHGRVPPRPAPTTAPHGLHARAPPWRARSAPWMARIGQYPRGAHGVPPP